MTEFEPAARTTAAVDAPMDVGVGAPMDVGVLNPPTPIMSPATTGSATLTSATDLGGHNRKRFDDEATDGGGSKSNAVRQTVDGCASITPATMANEDDDAAAVTVGTTRTLHDGGRGMLQIEPVSATTVPGVGAFESTEKTMP